MHDPAVVSVADFTMRRWRLTVVAAVLQLISSILPGGSLRARRPRRALSPVTVGAG
jgi:hypothetical protein